MSSTAPLMLSVSGCRGIVGESLTPEVAARFAGCFGGWLRARAQSPGRSSAARSAPSVVLARDGRVGGEMIHAAATAGLLAAGCNVIDLGIAMTPTVGVMVDEKAAAGGMVLTASHNPQQWNGLKCIVRVPGTLDADACAPAASMAQEIINQFKQGSPALVGWQELGSISRDQGAQPHAAKVMSALESIGASWDEIRQHQFSVVLDSVNASGIEGGRRILDNLSCLVRHEGGAPTGLFPHTPEPTRENLAEFCAIVRESGAAVGFAQDPDADRLAIIDERGSYIGEEYTLVLAAMALLEADQRRAPADKRGPGKPRVIAVNLSTSRMIDDVAARYGATVVRTAVGEANVVEAMKSAAASGQAHVVMGGEGNGGVIWPSVTYIRDSLSAMALTLLLLSRAAKPLSEIVKSIPTYAIEKRKVDLARREDAQPAVEAVARAYATHRVDRQDGVRVDYTSGPLAGKAWLHVRASNTEPIMRLIAEAPSPDQAKGVLDDAARVIAQAS
ncbi:MAG: phosphoglucosamine mutase [Planctomycetota bacterium]|nr:phosphoglucosamine mutase [Planctomycetota bacterium]